jgi:hypothetical protein
MAGAAVRDPDMVHARLEHGWVVIDHLIDSPPTIQKGGVRLAKVNSGRTTRAAYQYLFYADSILLVGCVI